MSNILPLRVQCPGLKSRKRFFAVATLEPAARVVEKLK